MGGSSCSYDIFSELSIACEIWRVLKLTEQTNIPIALHCCPLDLRVLFMFTSQTVAIIAQT